MDELLVPIVSRPKRYHLAAEDNEGGIASIEIVIDIGRRIVVTVSPDDDDVQIDFRVRPR